MEVTGAVSTSSHKGLQLFIWLQLLMWLLEQQGTHKCCWVNSCMSHSCHAECTCTVQKPILSREALDAAKRLARLSPSEGLGVMGWMLSSLAADVPSTDVHAIAPWLHGFCLHAASCAQACERRQGKN